MIDNQRRFLKKYSCQLYSSLCSHCGNVISSAHAPLIYGGLRSQSSPACRKISARVAHIACVTYADNVPLCLKHHICKSAIRYGVTVRIYVCVLTRRLCILIFNFACKACKPISLKQQIFYFLSIVK